MTLRIAEVCIYGRDLRRMREFYDALLGKGPVLYEEGRHLFYRLGDVMLLVFNPDKTRESTDVPPHGCYGSGHIAFYVEEEEYEGWKERLRSMGVEIEREVVWGNGAKSFYFRDPAGNSLEITVPKIWAWVEERETTS